MKLYRCIWPNGDVSFCQARSKTDAVSYFDCEAPVSIDMITECLHFMIHLKAAHVIDGKDFDNENIKYIKWELDHLGDQTYDDLELHENSLVERVLKGEVKLEIRDEKTNELVVNDIIISSTTIN